MVAREGLVRIGGDEVRKGALGGWWGGRTSVGRTHFLAGGPTFWQEYPPSWREDPLLGGRTHPDLATRWCLDWVEVDHEGFRALPKALNPINS